MKLTCLNNEITVDECKHLESDAELVAAITNYEYSSYEGYGEFIAVDKNGTWYSYEVGHCSCYGPLDNNKSGRFTKKEILKLHPQFEEFINSH